MTKEHILIVCYTFPPNNEIGGRRWAKFAKYLSKENYQVHVITKRTNRNNFDPKPFGLENVIIHEVDGFYPESLIKSPNNFWDKLKFNFWARIAPLFCKGTYYDKSIFMESVFTKKMESVTVKHDIKLVFVTLAPFYLAYYAVKLKDKLNFFLVIDFRDPWTWGKGYGYSLISEKRKLFDFQIEKKVVEKADLITSPSTEILNHLSSHHSLNRDKLFCVPHAIDTDKINIEQSSSSKSEQSFKCIYAGNLYDGYNTFLNKIIHLLKSERDKCSEFYDGFQFDIYCTNENITYFNEVKLAGLDSKIKFYSAITEEELFKKMVLYDYSVIYFPQRYKDFISTKFYELIYFKLPIIYVGSIGVVSKFITDHSFGCFIHIDEVEEKFIKELKDFSSENYSVNFNIENYTFEKVTLEMMNKINNLRAIN